MRVGEENFIALIEKAHSLMDSKQYSAAISLFEKAIPLSQDDHNKAVAFGNIGFCYSKLGNNEEACDYLKAAIKYDPGYALAFLNLGKITQSEGNIEAAIEQYEHAINVDPECDAAHAAKGVCLAKLCEYDKAAVCFAKAASLCHDDAGYHNNAGVCYAFADEPQKSVKHFAIQIRLLRKADKNTSDVFVNAAQCYFEIGDFFRAAKAADCAIKTKPQNGRAHETLGDIMAAVNQFSRAVCEYTAALRYTPNEDLFEKITSVASASKLFADCTEMCHNAEMGAITSQTLLKFLEDKINKVRQRFKL